MHLSVSSPHLLPERHTHLFFFGSQMLVLWVKFKGAMHKNLVNLVVNPWSNTPWHRVRPPREIKFSASLCSFSNLRNDHMITIHCSIRLHQETAIKKPQMMLRTAPNFSNSINRVSAHSLRHQTAASLNRFLLNSEHNSPLSCSSSLLWGRPDESTTECG